MTALAWKATLQCYSSVTTSMVIRCITMAMGIYLLIYDDRDSGFCLQRNSLIKKRVGTSKLKHCIRISNLSLNTLCEEGKPFPQYIKQEVRTFHSILDPPSSPSCIHAFKPAVELLPITVTLIMTSFCTRFSRESLTRSHLSSPIHQPMQDHVFRLSMGWRDLPQHAVQDLETSEPCDTCAIWKITSM